MMPTQRRIGYAALLAIGAGLLGLALLPFTHLALAQTLSNQVFLPIIHRPPTATITFGATADSNGLPSPPITEFPAGTRKIYYDARIEGAAGQEYRLEWTINETRQPGIDDSGTVTGDIVNIAGVICSTRNGSCDDPTDTLPAGTYTLQVYVNDFLLAEANATVAAGLRQAAPSAQRPSAASFLRN